MNAADFLFGLDSYYSSAFPVDIWIFVGLFGVDIGGHQFAC